MQPRFLFAFILSAAAGLLAAISLAPASLNAEFLSTFGGPDPTVPGAPRYQNFYAPGGSSAQSSEGEFNIGFDPKTGRSMVMNLEAISRLTPPELLTPAKPECCEALWEDASPSTTSLVA